MQRRNFIHKAALSAAVVSAGGLAGCAAKVEEKSPAGLPEGAAVSSLIGLSFTGYDAPLTTPPLQFWPIALLIFVLIFPTVISYLLIPIGLKYLNTTVVSIYGYLILIVASIVSFAVGQDRFGWEQVVAMILICIGVYWVEIAETGKNGNRKRPHSPTTT